MRRRLPRQKPICIPEGMQPPIAVGLYYQAPNRDCIRTVDGRWTFATWHYVAGVQEIGGELRAYGGEFKSEIQASEYMKAMELGPQPPEPKSRRTRKPRPRSVPIADYSELRAPRWPTACGSECFGLLCIPPIPFDSMTSEDSRADRAMIGAVCTLTRDLAPAVRREAMQIVVEILRDAYRADGLPLPPWIRGAQAGSLNEEHRL